MCYHGLWVSHPCPAFFGYPVDYTLSSLDSKLDCSIPKFFWYNHFCRNWLYQALHRLPFPIIYTGLVRVENLGEKKMYQFLKVEIV